MIAGTIVFEGLCVQFSLIGDSLIGDRVEYTVQDGMTGTTARKSVTPGEWAATLALMIGGDSPEIMSMEQGLYDIAEAAQPDAASLVGAGDADAKTILTAVRNVRLIP